MGNQQPTSTCYMSFEGCFCNRLYIGFQKEHTDEYLGSFSDSRFNPTGKVVLYSSEEPIMALFVEDMYHRCWQVRTEDRFANKQWGGFSHQVNFILETAHGCSFRDQETREKISKTMVRKGLGTFNPAVREAGNRANRGKKRDDEKRMRIRAGTALSNLKRGRYSRSKRPLSEDEIQKLWDIIEEAQRLGVYSVPLSEGKREGFPKGKQDIVCSAEKSAAEVSPRVGSNETS